jgi:hypothetical protein
MFLRGAPGPGATSPAFINGQAIADPKVLRLNIYQFANVLGEQGWEVISTDVEGKRMVFKREKS